jgi:energy-coupling factor transporter ATP-binding protein EcfA2
VILKKQSNKSGQLNSQKSNAIIILLYGTSTSGKTTICQSLKKLISDLKVDGTDSAFKRLEEHNYEEIFNYINNNKDQFPDLEHMYHLFTGNEIFNGILNERVNVNNKEVLLMLDLDESTFENMLEEKFSSGLQMEKQAIVILRRIAKSYLDQLYILVHENMFNLAINNSLKEIPTILDIVPHPAHSGQFMIDLFLGQLKKVNHTGPTHIALIHCSIPQLSDRILERNRHAIIHGDLENVRDQPFPFRQYSQLFGAVNCAQHIHKGKLRIEDARKAIAPFCTNFVEIDKILEQIGFNAQLDEIEIDAKCNFDGIYDSGLQTSEEIAKKIYKACELPF